MMFSRNASLVLLAVIGSSSAFTTTTPMQPVAFRTTSALSMAEEAAAEAPPAPSGPMEKAIKELRSKYKAGGADTEFAKRFGHLVGAKVRTVGEAFAEFTKVLGYSVNPLYKNMVTDIVGSTHLVVVSARFQRDPVWSLGIISTLDLLLKNYPEKDVSEQIVTAFFTSLGLDEAEIRAEADAMKEWAAGATKEQVEAALSGEGDSVLATTATKIKGDEFWMYSRYFGIGLLQVMKEVGLEMDKDAVYPVMEEWMGNKLGRSHLSACSDSDLFFRVKDKLDMMETLMKEIEIREKKRMAERLEEKAEAALRAADREEKYEKEIEKEVAASRDRASS